MARTGGYCRSAVWRPCVALRHTPRFQNQSVVCSGSPVTISTVMKLRWSIKRGGINVKRIQRALAHTFSGRMNFFVLFMFSWFQFAGFVFRGINWLRWLLHLLYWFLRPPPPLFFLVWVLFWLCLNSLWWLLKFQFPNWLSLSKLRLGFW